MPIKVKFLSVLKELTEGQKIVEVDGCTLGEVIRKLGNKFPQVQSRILDEQGDIRNGYNIIVIRGPVASHCRDLDFSLQDKDEIIIVPVIAGG